MATTKTATKAAAEKKVETKTTATATTKKVEPKKAETVKETKATKSTEAKTTAKVTETKAATKTTKTAAKKPTAKKEKNVYVQFAGLEFDAATIEKAVKADYTAKNGKKTMTSVNIYIKPEDMKAYYVIDGIIGDIAL